MVIRKGNEEEKRSDMGKTKIMNDISAQMKEAVKILERIHVELVKFNENMESQKLIKED